MCPPALISPNGKTVAKRRGACVNGGAGAVQMLTRQIHGSNTGGSPGTRSSLQYKSQWSATKTNRPVSGALALPLRWAVRWGRCSGRALGPRSASVLQRHKKNGPHPCTSKNPNSTNASPRHGRSTQARFFRRPRRRYRTWLTKTWRSRMREQRTWDSGVEKATPCSRRTPKKKASLSHL